MTPDPAHDVLRGGPLLIGHRGAAGLAPENTMPSFREAAETWAVDMIELDVRASADGHCVVIHDATVDRTTDGTGAVADLTLAELRALDAGCRFRSDDGEFPFRGRGITVSTLDEVLEAFPSMRFTVEIKTGTVQEPLHRTLRRHDSRHRVVVAGMRHQDRARFSERDGAMSGSVRDLRVFYVLHRLRLTRFWPGGASVFQVPERDPWDAEPGEGRQIVSPGFVRDARRRGVPVHVWTVNDVDDMTRLLDWGVDGLITDRPDRGARVLTRLGRPVPPGLA